MCESFLVLWSADDKPAARVIEVDACAWPSLRDHLHQLSDVLDGTRQLDLDEEPAATLGEASPAHFSIQTAWTCGSPQVSNFLAVPSAQRWRGQWSGFSPHTKITERLQTEQL